MYSRHVDTPSTVSLPGVLSNDSDVESSPLSAVLVAGPTHGSLALNANGSFTYTPASNYNGPDSFTFKANDGSLDSNVATVSITVTAVNDAPVAADHADTTNEDTAQAIMPTASDGEGSAVTNATLAGPTHRAPS